MRRGPAFPPATSGKIHARSATPPPTSQNNNNTRSVPYNSANSRLNNNNNARTGGLTSLSQRRNNVISSSSSNNNSRMGMMKSNLNNTNNNNRGKNLMNNNNVNPPSRQASTQLYPRVDARVIHSLAAAVRQEQEQLKNSEDLVPELETQLERAIEQRDFELEKERLAHLDRTAKAREDMEETRRDLLGANQALQEETQEEERIEETITLTYNQLETIEEDLIKTAQDRLRIRQDTRGKKTEILQQEKENEQEALNRLKEASEMATDLSEDGVKYYHGAKALRVETEDIKGKTAALEMARREMFSEYEELKGTIRVYCRVRGVTTAEELEEVNRFLTFPDDDCSRSSNSNNTSSSSNNNDDENDNSNNNYQVTHNFGRTLEVTSTRDNATSTGRRDTQTKFSYDRVFGLGATQAQIFEDVGPLVDCAVDGYKVCIFASGQTGSGKTFTMQGFSKSPGLIPRAIERVFERAQLLREDGWKYTVKASFVEIYNDQIRNLLETSSTYHRTFFENKGNGTNGKPMHEIIHHGRSDTTVSNINEVIVRDPAHVHKLLSIAENNRSVAQTKMNDRSSRSHSVFTMRIEGHSDKINNGTTTIGILNLVDLAGSERVNDSGATGQQMKEAIAINKSLMHLGECINSMGSGKNAVIAWRNCKLTYMLQNFLSGDGAKMLMFVNVSNKEEHVQETLNSLRFAAKVNATQIGQAKKRIA